MHQNDFRDGFVELSRALGSARSVGEAPQSEFELCAEFAGRCRDAREDQDLLAKLQAKAGGLYDGAVLHLVQELDALLQHVASAGQSAGRSSPRTLLDEAVAWTQKSTFSRPPGQEWRELVSAALNGSGVLVEEGGDFRFVHPSVARYFAAGSLAAPIPRPRTRDVLDLFKPDRTPVEQPVAVWAAARWLAEGRLEQRHLRKLVGVWQPLHRAGILAELLALGVELDRSLRRRAETRLRRLVRKPRHVHWNYGVERLVALERGAAVQELRRTSAKQRSRSERRRVVTAFVAVDVEAAFSEVKRLLGGSGVISYEDEAGLVAGLAAEDPERAAELLTCIAEGRTGRQVPHRTEAARLLCDVDQDRGCALLSEFASSAELTDPARVQALKRLLELGRPEHHPLLAALFREVTDEQTRDRLAGLYAEHDSSGFRADLVALSEDDGVPTRLRRDAAVRRVREYGDGHAVLLSEAERAEAPVEFRIEAVNLAGQRDRVTAAKISMEVLERCSSIGEDAVAAACALQSVDPVHGRQELIKLARQQRRSVRSRQRAISEITGASPDEVVDLHLGIVREDHGDFADKLASARKAAEFGRISAERAFRELVANKSLPASDRISAALDAEQYGKDLCRELLLTLARADALASEHRLKAAENLRGRGAGEHERVLLELVADGRMEVAHRIRAARHVQEEAAPRLVRCAAKGDGQDRFDAAQVLAAVDRDKAAEAFRGIADDHKVPRALQRKAAREAAKRTR